ncbi:Cellulose synthase-like protein G2 [Camellia lanceoleosa]|nr:Cellulose synthase-like protein G2 [Camellia lanceoleosa]
MININSTYKLFKKNVEKASKEQCDGIADHVLHDRPAQIRYMPLLVYVSREKRPSHPHRFKAGALNALLRVSGIMSNGPYVLVLDCDMYCNDPTSARQAMCFHLDPEISRFLAFVQYPQMFYNVSKNDIYDNQSRSTYKMKWQGMDGLRGPLFTGTGYYLKRKALYETPNQEGIILEFTLDVIVEEAMILAGCTFEKGTKWGKEIGYVYDSLLESTFTGYLLHCKGWRSVYLYPKRPCFLGCTTIDMKDAMIQIMKWCSGLFQVAFSRFSPLTYGMSKMSILQSMCYGSITFAPLHSISFLIYGTIPQLCFFSGIPLYPKVSNPWFAVFATVYVSSLCQYLYEVLYTDGSLRTCGMNREY